MSLPPRAPSFFKDFMFQPLDYLFLIMLGFMCLNGAYQYWDNFMRTKEVKDDLIERWFVKEYYGSRKQSYRERELLR